MVLSSKEYRKRAGLSQAEIAFLLGGRSGSKVSRYEHGARRPSFETVIAYEVILHAALSDLFAGMYRDIEKQTRRRAGRLIQKLQSARCEDPRVIQKIVLLRSLQGGNGHDAR